MVLPSAGAILEVQAPTESKTKLRVRWRHAVQQLLLDIGWSNEVIVTRDQGLSQILAISAPIDQLLCATHLTEWAWELALAGGHLKNPRLYLDCCDQALSEMALAANPRLRSLHAAARVRGVLGLLSESDYSLGEGEAAKLYPLDDLPLADEIAWRPKRRRIPIALVTGTNGKTTTVRILAHLLRQQINGVGFCSTDYVQIGEEVLQRDDYSGPTGARLVLRHANTEAAVLEVARGGMLRRGLQVCNADVGVLTNVANDHLGENGIHTLDQLAEAKFTITRGLRLGAPIVVNADDLHCRSFARKLSNPIFWFAMSRPAAAIMRSKVPRAGLIYLNDYWIHIERPNLEPVKLLDVREAPLSLNGGASFNVQNILAAAAAAICLKVPDFTIQRALREFGAHPNDNPGRANIYPIRGAKVMVDYGHNPDGVRAILQATIGLTRKRLLIGIGLPGDRSLDAAKAVADTIAEVKPDRVIVKEMPNYLRGRPVGELSGVLRKTLSKRGVSAKRVQYVQNDAETIRLCLEWLKPGDLAVLFVHEDVAQLSAQLFAESDL
jgi:cyanophycin synthetase